MKTVNNNMPTKNSEEGHEAIQTYYSAIGKFPLLKRKEVIELFTMMQKWSKNR